MSGPKFLCLLGWFSVHFWCLATKDLNTDRQILILTWQSHVELSITLHPPPKKYSENLWKPSSPELKTFFFFLKYSWHTMLISGIHRSDLTIFFFFPVWVFLFVCFKWENKRLAFKLGWWVNKFRFLICYDISLFKEVCKHRFLLTGLTSLWFHHTHYLQSGWTIILVWVRLKKGNTLCCQSSMYFFPSGSPKFYTEYLLWLFSTYNRRKDCVPYFNFKNHEFPTFHPSYWPK